MTRALSFFLRSGILLLLLASLFLRSAQAQCSPSIPSGAVVYDQNEPYGQSDETLWVCPGTSFSLTNSSGFPIANLTIFLEEASFLQVLNPTGNIGHTIYLSQGAGLFLGQGSSNVTVYRSPNSVLIDSGGVNNSITVCDPLEYDLSQAPSPGCEILSTEWGGDPSSEIQVHSLRGQVRVVLPEGSIDHGGPVRMSIYDMLGKELFDKSLERNEAILNPDLPAGIYSYALRRDAELIASGKLRLR